MWGIKAASVFDGSAVAERPTVLIDGGEVRAVGEPLPESIEVVDLPTATVLPGLVDCHQHLVFDGNGTLEEQVCDRSDEELAARARSNARRALEGGVTTLRDLGDRAFVTLDLRGDPGLPNLLTAGPPLTDRGGHCWYLGGECDGLDGLLAGVDERIERGCDVVKIMATGGGLTPTVPMWKSQFDRHQIIAVVERAHAAGIPVAAHAHGVDGIRDAVAAGVDTIEHCTFFTEAMHAAPPDDLLEVLAASDSALSATLGATPDRVLPPLFEASMATIREAFGRVHEGGGTVLVGTDAGINAFKPHDVMPRAMAPLVDLGMTPLEALAAMTSRAADVLGLPSVGRLAPGAAADIVAVEGDPLADPDDLTRVSHVWRAGQSVERSAA